MTLAEEVELEMARKVVRHAKMCVAYARGEGRFDYRKKIGFWSILFGLPLQSKVWDSIMYDPITMPAPSLVEQSEAIIAKYENMNAE